MKNEFKKGDYVILISSEFDLESFSLNYCYKQRQTIKSFSVEKDNNNSSNGYNSCSYDNKGKIKWRYATQQEIDHYNKINKPYDVTKLPVKKLDTKEERLLEAKKLYPIRTKFNSLGGFKNCIVPEKFNIKQEGDFLIMYIKDSGDRIGILYHNGKWAEIISKPEVKLTKDNIIDGETYFDGDVIFIAPYRNTKGIRISTKSYASNNVFNLKKGIIIATQQQKNWLNACINESSFIPFKDVENRSEKSIIKWSKGSYAVAVKGNWGCFKGDREKLNVGSIFTITNDTYEKNAKVEVMEGDVFWVYTKNLEWFATKYEAEEYSKILLNKSNEIKFEKGKWYKDLSCKGLFIKFDKLHSTLEKYIISDERIGSTGKHKSIKGDIWETTTRNWVEASLEEIKQYLPEGHCDLVSEEYVPKVGDWVFTDMFNVKDRNGLKFSTSKCFKIIKLDEESLNQPNFKVECNKNEKAWCYPRPNNASYLRKALPHEIPNNLENTMEKQEEPFKVGDKLIGKCIDHIDITSYGNKLGVLNKYFIADKIVYDGKIVKLYSNGTHWKCNIKDISFYNQDNLKPKIEEGSYKTDWKVGDKFEVIVNNVEGSKLQINTTYQVSKVLLKSVIDLDGWCIGFKNIKPVIKLEQYLHNQLDSLVKTKPWLCYQDDIVLSPNLTSLRNYSLGLDPYQEKTNNKTKIKKISTKAVRVYN